MDLPRELRDMVYRELLIPVNDINDSSPDGRRRYYSLQPAILRLCKQTHKESSKVLYEETKWVLVATFEDETRVISNMKEKTAYPFLGVQSPLRFPSTPVLRMDLSSLNDKDKYEAFMLIPLQEFQLFGKNFLCKHHTSIALGFDGDAMQTSAIREVLLDCCREFRGSQSVTITGLDPTTECATLVYIMTTPISRHDEHLERANIYQERAANQVARGLFLDAEKTNHAGIVYMTLAKRRRVGGCLRSSWSYGKFPFAEPIVDFHIASAYCNIKAGLHKTARILLDSLLARKRPSPTEQQEVKIRYYKGLALVAERENVQAVQEFRMVLTLEPGHKGADEEIDSMEARLKQMTQTRRYGIQAYLREFVKPHRHREPGSAKMSVHGLPDVSTLEEGWGARALA